jgi:predicted nucleic acid-binding protein
VAYDLVLDSCVVAKCVLPEADSAKADQLVRDAATAGQRVRAIDLALAEVANAIWKQVIQGNIAAADAGVRLQLLLALPVDFVDHRPLLPAALDVAIRYRLPVYDALFVAAVRQQACDRLSSDEPLVRAVQADVPSITLLRNWP